MLGCDVGEGEGGFTVRLWIWNGRWNWWNEVDFEVDCWVCWVGSVGSQVCECQGMEALVWQGMETVVWEVICFLDSVWRAVVRMEFGMGWGVFNEAFVRLCGKWRGTPGFYTTSLTHYLTLSHAFTLHDTHSLSQAAAGVQASAQLGGVSLSHSPSGQ